MKYTTEDWWNARLCSTLGLAGLREISIMDSRRLFGIRPDESFDKHADCFKQKGALNKFVVQRRRTIKPQRISVLQHNMRRFASLLGLTRGAADWLTFAAYLQANSDMMKRFPVAFMKRQFLLNGYTESTQRNQETKDNFLTYWSGLKIQDLHELVDRGFLFSYRDRGAKKPYYHSGADMSTFIVFAALYQQLSLRLVDWKLTDKQLFLLFINEMKPTKLHGRDFQHIASKLPIDYLHRAAQTKTKGANILVYGPPGTGKTEFVRWLCSQAGLRAFTAVTDNITAGAVLPAAMLSATFLHQYTKGALVVDEAEDVFVNTNYSGWLMPDSNRTSKQQLNVFLETNEVPIIWICNQRSVIDPAVRRRCDVVIEIDRLPKTARLKGIRKHTHGLGMAAQWKEDLARNDDLTLADIGSACRAVKLAGNRKGQPAEAAVEEVLRGKLKERQLSTAVRPKDRSVINYRLEFVNADTDLQHIQQALQSGRTGRFCFYGPPGTGKTEFVRQTANQAEKQLIVKPASSLLGMYVGQTEKNIARAFAEANEADAILLIDEADSFLRNREGARQSWEVSQVNELLVQMEKFDGTLVCCSNLMDGIDPAAFRRFDLKIKFNFMRTHQVIAMLEQATGPVTEDLQRRAAKLRCCTPGDFAAVLRRSEFMQQPLDAATLLQQLAQEIEFKPEGKSRAIGF